MKLLVAGVAAVVAGSVFAVTATPAAVPDSGIGLPDTTARWDGMLHVRVGCGAAGPACAGDMAVYAPSDHVHSISGNSFKVAPGAITTVTIDPNSNGSKKLAAASSVFVRIDPQPPESGPRVEATLKLIRPSRPTPKPLGPPTRRQVVKDRAGDSRIAGLDLLLASATRKGTIVVFQVVNSSPLDKHDGSGNPITPCIEFPWPAAQGGSGRTPMQMCGDGALRGYTIRFWPHIPTRVGARSVTWRVPLKYLPKRSFRWRGYCSEGDRVRDAAPNKGYRTFVR